MFEIQCILCGTWCDSDEMGEDFVCHACGIVHSPIARRYRMLCLLLKEFNDHQLQRIAQKILNSDRL